MLRPRALQPQTPIRTNVDAAASAHQSTLTQPQVPPPPNNEKNDHDFDYQLMPRQHPQLSISD